MQPSPVTNGDLAISTAEQVADLLAVISWAEVFLAEELESMVSEALRAQLFHGQPFGVAVGHAAAGRGCPSRAGPAGW